MKLRFLLFAFLISVVVSAAALAQPAGTPDMNRPRNYDVQHYILRVSFDIAKKTVIGDTTVQLKPLDKPLSSVELDSNGIRYSSAVLEGSNTELKYRLRGNKIIVDLDKEYSPNELIGIRFKYTTQPKKGVYFVEAYSGEDRPRHSEQIWTQGE